MTLTEPAPSVPTPTPAESAAAQERRADVFSSIVARLSRQSVEKHFDAYIDVPWDEPGCEIDPADERWMLWDGDALSATAWYQGLPAETRSRIGLHRVASAMRVGAEFENLLQRGLLAYALRMGNNDPEFRYVHHEVIEESQHSMMFQEFVNRTGLGVRGMPMVAKRIAEIVVLPLATRFPELWFFFVLGGEDPVDHMQRRQLRGGIAHPLLETIVRNHVTEEARHVSFARNYLKNRVPARGRVRRAELAVATPLLFGLMSRLMVDLPIQMRVRYHVPRAVQAEIRRSPQRRALLAATASKPKKLCQELGLITRWSAPLWRLMGLTESAVTTGRDRLPEPGRGAAA